MPVSLAEAKLQLNILSSADDTLIPIYISGVVRQHEKLEGRKLTDRTVTVILESDEKEVEITEFPFRGVTKCYASDSLDERTSMSFRIDLNEKKISLLDEPPEGTVNILIEYEAGLSEADKQEEKLALLAGITEAYVNRGDQNFDESKSLGFRLAMRNRHGGI